MTEPVRERLRQALNDYFSEESEGGLLTDYVVALAGVSMKDAQSTHYGFTASESPIHSLLGLIRLADDHFDSYQYELEEDDDDEA